MAATSSPWAFSDSASAAYPGTSAMRGLLCLVGDITSSSIHKAILQDIATNQRSAYYQIYYEIDINPDANRIHTL
jgi:hypothetical protein